MATHTLLTPKIWLDGYALNPRIFSTSQEYSCDTQDDTAFGTTGVRSTAAGMLTHRYVDQAYHSAGSGTDVDDVLFSRVGTGAIVRTVAPVAGVEGEYAYTTQILQARYNPFDGGSVGEMHATSFEGQNDGTPLVRGTILNNASEVGTGAGTAFQVGALSATQIGYAALHITDPVALTSIDVKIESDDVEGFGGTPEDQITFTQQTAAGSEWQTVAGAVTDDWWRINVTALVGTSCTVVVVLGIL